MKVQYEPKTMQQKLGYLVEECGEVLAAAGKSIRWGLDSWNPELPPQQRETNQAWLLRELKDLSLAIALVRGAFYPEPDTNNASTELQALRVLKEAVELWLESDGVLYRPRLESALRQVQRIETLKDA